MSDREAFDAGREANVADGVIDEKFYIGDHQQMTPEKLISDTVEFDRAAPLARPQRKFNETFQRRSLAHLLPKDAEIHISDEAKAYAVGR